MAVSRNFIAALTLSGAACLTQPAMASPMVNTPCSYFGSANGTTGFPGTSLGTLTVGTLQVGIANSPETVCGVSQSAFSAGVTANNPSIYTFTVTAGLFVTLSENLGNNGTNSAVNVELDTLASPSATQPSAVLASIQIPFTAGPSAVYQVFNGYLAPGSYAVDTYLNSDNSTDPKYQLNFSVIPEPGSLALIVPALAALIARRRRKA